VKKQSKYKREPVYRKVPRLLKSSMQKGGDVEIKNFNEIIKYFNNIPGKPSYKPIRIIVTPREPKITKTIKFEVLSTTADTQETRRMTNAIHAVLEKEKSYKIVERYGTKTLTKIFTNFPSISQDNFFSVIMFMRVFPKEHETIFKSNSKDYKGNPTETITIELFEIVYSNIISVDSLSSKTDQNGGPSDHTVQETIAEYINNKEYIVYIETDSA